MRTGQVRVIGPMTKEDKARWDRMWDRVEACDKAIAVYTNDLKLREYKPYRQSIKDEIAYEKRIRASIVDGIRRAETAPSAGIGNGSQNLTVILSAFHGSRCVSTGASVASRPRDFVLRLEALDVDVAFIEEPR